MMKRRKKIRQRVVKGTSRAVVISIAVHAGLFLLAGALVIFTIKPKPPVEFEPPPQVQVPKMPLQKLKVRTQKPSKPKSTAKLTAVVNKVDLNVITFPDLPSSGIGTGFGSGGGSGGFTEMDEVIGDVTIFGEGKSIGSDLEGTFYDLKRRRSGGQIMLDRTGFMTAVGKFTRSGWNTSALAKYYKAPKKLYATSIMVPPMHSVLAPGAFNEPDVQGLQWLVHYKGTMVHPEDIKFRFWGHGDDILLVRVNKKLVLNACWPGNEHYYSDKHFSPPGHRTYSMGNNLAAGGSWVELKANTPVELEILIGEEPGGVFCAMLCVEVEGVDYERNKFGGPILPMFKMAEPSRDLMDAIYYNLYPGEACITNGPVFSDY